MDEVDADEGIRSWALLAGDFHQLGVAGEVGEVAAAAGVDGSFSRPALSERRVKGSEVVSSLSKRSPLRCDRKKLTCVSDFNLHPGLRWKKSRQTRVS